MDLAKLEAARFDAEVPERLELVDKLGKPYPDDDGLGTPFLMVKGADCQAVREASRRLLADALRQVSDDDDEAQDAFFRGLDPALRIPRAAAAVASWGGIGSNGVPLEFNEDNLIRLLSFEHHLGQVERKMRDHGRPFTMPSSDSSPTPDTPPDSESGAPTASQ